jgi:hypothetical protein
MSEQRIVELEAEIQEVNQQMNALNERWEKLHEERRQLINKRDMTQLDNVADVDAAMEILKQRKSAILAQQEAAARAPKVETQNQKAKVSKK